ncbi:methyltransferase domain-containing protein [Nocardia sp. BMG51109]|uniref:methyltransferase domain-containing protein n=1 Tax=Nocardia sp. BMG51109 TaxID=1056816 RepID=UPI0004646744|nr:methyltransferase domain-containing protein [Nocardia sp. BMG51109]
MGESRDTRKTAFLGQVTTELGISLSAVLIHLGDLLGLYRAMGDSAPVTSGELAHRCGVAERYVREWLHNQAAAGWVEYRPGDGTFVLPPEHAEVVADPDSPTYLLGGFDGVAAAWADAGMLATAFRTGAGIPWGEHDHRHLSGLERSFQPFYRELLVRSWLPSIEGLVPRLRRGARIADIGCGAGGSAILLARSFPASRVTGFDFDDATITTARSRARDAGAPANLSFQLADARGFPGTYDLICAFNAVHDMGDPVGTARHAREHLASDGVLMLVEPTASDHAEGNHHPLGRFFYAASTIVCVPGALAQDGEFDLGNQVGPARWTELLTEAGFTSIRLAAHTPVLSVFEARP